MAEAVVHTEASLLGLLERRYRGEVHGNGPAWAFVPKVRNAAGFQATRTIDAIAMSLWPSRGLELHGHEIKCSRSDWLRELKDPSKAEAFTDLVDRWWLVVSDPGIVREGELPPTWGLMVPRGRGLAVKVPAPKLPPSATEWMPRTFLAALLRASTRTASVQPEEVGAAVAAARERFERTHADNIDGWRVERDQLRKEIADFEGASGIKISQPWNATAEQVGMAVKLVLNGEAEVQRYLDRLAGIATMAEQLARAVRGTIAS